MATPTGYQQQKNNIISQLTDTATTALAAYTSSGVKLANDSLKLSSYSPFDAALQSDVQSIQANEALLKQAISSASSLVQFAGGGESSSAPITALTFGQTFANDAQAMFSDLVDTVESMVSAAGTITDMLNAIAQEQSTDPYYAIYVTPDAKTVTANLTKAFNDTLAALTATIPAVAAAMHLSSSISMTASEANDLLNILNEIDSSSDSGNINTLSSLNTDAGKFASDSADMVQSLMQQVTTDTQDNFQTKSTSDTAAAALASALTAAK